jgi:hypothetical protein
VAQAGSLPPIVNRRFHKLLFAARRPINNRPQDTILPHKAARPQPKRRLQPVTGETACPTKIFAARDEIKTL